MALKDEANDAAARTRTAIVVGFDGSDAGRAALEFGLEEARLRALTLRVVSAWHYPFAGYMGGGFEPPGPRLDPGELQRAAEAELERALEELGADPAAVAVERRVREGHAAAVLLEEARDAALLVVGSRGHGGFAGLLLGSVSQQCVAHAPCPVAVVHGPGELEQRSRGR
jgi:nucleotide-binding universal stress UspA family protein